MHDRVNRNSPRPSLQQLYATHDGKVSDKWSSYLEEYDRLLAPYRSRHVRVLEVGVQNGGSLEIWSSYFRRAAKILGCDIDPACATLRFDDQRVSVIVGDAKASETRDAIMRETDGLDIVIDDGSHQSADVIATFATYFPLLSNGGLYIIEDLHCSYWQRFGGGLFSPYSALTFLKRLADVINHEHWGIPRTRSDFLSGIASQYDLQLSDALLETIHSVEFVNSLGVIRKQHPKRNTLRRRVIAGSTASIYPKALQRASRKVVRPNELNNDWTARTLPPEEELPHRLRDLAEARLQLVESERDLTDVRALLERTEHHVQQLDGSLDEHERQLAAVTDALAQRERDHQALSEALAAQKRAARRQMDLAATLTAEKELLRSQVDAVQRSPSWRLMVRVRGVSAAMQLIRRGPSLAKAIRSVVLTSGVRSGVRLLRDYHVLRSSILFDSDYYAGRNPDVVESGMDLALHYLFYGASEGRDPGPAFSTTWYLHQHPDVLDAGVNPLVHYIRFGMQEGRRPVGTIQEKASTSVPSSRPNTTPVPVSQLAASVARRLEDLEQYKAAIAEYSSSRQHLASTGQRSPTIAIYTAICAGYDTVKLPEHLDPRFDYFLFTDAPAPDTEVWQVRPIAYFDDDPTRVSRYVKTHPHHLLQEYDVAIWIDSNVMIVGDIYPLVEQFLSSRAAVGALPHPLRKSVYEELEACERRNKDAPEVMRAQVSSYRAEGFEHSDLIESNFMMFDLRANLDSFFTGWWNEIARFSRRDQLSLNYALWRTGTNWHRIMEHPDSVRSHPDFGFAAHDMGAGPASTLIQALGCHIVDPHEGAPYSSVKAERIEAQADRRVDVIVCVHNALDEVQACLEPIVRERSDLLRSLIIVDDGSDGPTADYLRFVAGNRAWIQLLRNEEAHGYTRAANQGLAAASGSELVILLNSDTVVTERWIEKLADAVFSTPGAGIVGPMSNAASYQSIPDHLGSADQTAVNVLPSGMTPNDMNAHCERWTPAHVLPIVPLVHGFCFGITRAVIESIGDLDDVNFPRGYGEENDYCFRASDAGYGLVIATHTYIFHAKSRSYTRPARLALAQAGGATLRRMYGSSRVTRAVRAMDAHPALVTLRRHASKLTATHDSIGQADSRSIYDGDGRPSWVHGADAASTGRGR